MVTRAFDIMPTLVEKISAVGDETNRVHASVESAEAKHSGMKDFFAEFGMKWPEGSWIKHSPALGRIIVHNTPENMAIFEAIICPLDGGLTPTLIDIEIQFVEFALSDIETLAKQGPIDADSLKQLRRAGKGKLLYAPKVVTESGCEATVKDVKEYIYPTEFTCCGGGGSNSSSVAASTPPVVEPGSLETREVGTILQVLPEVSCDGSSINLTLTPHVVYEPTWRNYGATDSTGSNTQQAVNMPMPFFFTQTLDQSLSMFNGATILAGGGLPGRDKDRVVYVFVSVQQVDLEGKPLRRWEPTITEEGGKP